MKNIFIIFIILYLDLIAFTLILPLFPSIIEHYDTQNKLATTSDSALDAIHHTMEFMRKLLNMPDRSRYNQVLIGGILGSLFSMLQFIANPVIGAMSDMFGRRKVLILCMLGSISSYFVWLKANVFTVFLISRIIGGLTKGSVTLCTTMMSDITTKEDRGKGMAFIGLSFSFGFITGPLIGAYFASKSRLPDYDSSNIFAFPAQIAVVIQLITLLIVVSLLDETSGLKEAPKLSSSVTKVVNLINPLNILRSGSGPNSSTLQKIMMTNFLYLTLFSGLEFTLTFLTHERFQFDSMQQGRLFFVAGIIMMLVQGGYVRRVKNNKEKKVALQGIFVIIPAMILLSLASTVSMTYVALALYSFGAGTVVPCLTSLFTQNSTEKESGENIGKFRSAGALARAISPALTCAVYWSLGSSICYFVGGLLFIIPLCLLMSTKTDAHID